MKNNCNICDSKKVDSCNCTSDCYNEITSDCHKFKQKSDELYMQAICIQNDYKKLTLEAAELDAYAKELECQAKQLYAQANTICSNANKLKIESQNTLDLASFYCNKSIDCFKNINNASYSKSNCTSSYNCSTRSK